MRATLAAWVQQDNCFNYAAEARGGLRTRCPMQGKWSPALLNLPELVNNRVQKMPGRPANAFRPNLVTGLPRLHQGLVVYLESFGGKVHALHGVRFLYARSADVRSAALEAAAVIACEMVLVATATENTWTELRNGLLSDSDDDI